MAEEEKMQISKIRSVSVASRSETESEDNNAFVKNRKTMRSPLPKRKERENMDDVLLKILKDLQIDMKQMRNDNEEIKKSLQTEIQQMRAENITIMQEIRENNSNLRTTMEETRQEVENLKKSGNELRAEKEDLKLKMKILENKVEYQEKNKIKNNIVIKGISVQNDNIERQIQDFLKHNLNVEAIITEAYKIGNSINQGKTNTVVATIKNWTQKQEIMKNKNKLGATKIFIEHELTRSERGIQNNIKDRAREEKQKGNVVKIGYKKIKIENNWYNWDNEKETLIKVTSSKNE